MFSSSYYGDHEYILDENGIFLFNRIEEPTQEWQQNMQESFWIFLPTVCLELT